MTFDNLLVERSGAVALITLNRPMVLNALNVALLTDLDRALGDVERDPSTRALVVTGAGERAFAAGADVRELAGLTPEGARAHAAFGQRVFTRLHRIGKPSIAAVNGLALGGGCELALACTMRLASPEARLGQPEINLGIMPGFGGTQRLARLVGESRALDLLLTGRMVSAADALSIGLVDRVVAGTELTSQALAFANELAAKPNQAVRMILEAVAAGLDGTLEQGQATEATLFGTIVNSPDAVEGMTAFIEKRAPRFTRT